jgi:hypothetical protein
MRSVMDDKTAKMEKAQKRLWVITQSRKPGETSKDAVERLKLEDETENQTADRLLREMVRD